MVAAKKLLNDAKQKREKELQENINLLKEKEKEKIDKFNMINKSKRDKKKKSSSKKALNFHIKRPLDNELRTGIEIFHKERMESK